MTQASHGKETASTCIVSVIAFVSWTESKLTFTWHLDIEWVSIQLEMKMRLSWESVMRKDMHEIKGTWKRESETKSSIRNEGQKQSLYLCSFLFLSLLVSFSTWRYDPIDCNSWRGCFFFLLLFLQNLVQSSFTRSKTRVKGKTEDEGITHITRRERDRERESERGWWWCRGRERDREDPSQQISIMREKKKSEEEGRWSSHLQEEEVFSLQVRNEMRMLFLLQWDSGSSISLSFLFANNIVSSICRSWKRTLLILQIL